MQKYDSLNTLLLSDKEANQYFYSLPSYVQDQIASRSSNVNSYESLRDYAENLLRGDD